MTRPPLAAVVTLALALAPALSGLGLASPADAAPQPVVASADPGDGPPNTFFSDPGAVLDQAGWGSADGAAARRTGGPAERRPEPPRTRGTVVGQVVGRAGRPIRNALVSAVRFSDLGLAPDLSSEKRVLARTDGRGRFTLRQLREPYLVRVCSESVTDGRRSGECDQEPSKRFTPSYAGPDGTLNSWMRHTRMFQPQQPRRSVGRVVVQPPAVVAGTFKDSSDEGANVSGKNRVVYLTRTDGSIAATTQSDDQGHYRFEVAPGPYRVEADRDPGLRTDATVPGYTSKRLVARAGKTVRLSFKTRHAGIIRGLVTSNGTPLADQYLAVLDSSGQFAAGVVTNSIGRYVISSLEPGSYTVTTSYAGSDFVPKSSTVSVAKTTVATADLALDAGRSITFTPQDTLYPGANGSVDAELRDAAGSVVKIYQGAPTPITFAGLPNGSYRLFVRRSDVPAATEQVDFPWAVADVDLTTGTGNVPLLPVVLATPTVNLTGTIPKGSQFKLTAVPADAWLRPAYVDGDQATPMAVSWTEQESGGAYLVRGIVPGAYGASVTTARRERARKPSTTGGNVATTHSTVLVDGPAPTLSLTAPRGATVRGRFVYGNKRPAIAPLGFEVSDSGDRSWLFPTVSDAQKYDRPFRVERLHAGPATGRLLDLDGLYAEHPQVLYPDTLVSSARSEPGTAYWFSAGKKSLTLTAGKRVDVGTLRLKLHGVLRG